MSDNTSYDFFNEEKDPIKTASEQADDKLRGVLTKLSKWRSVVVLGAMALLTMVLPLISTSLVNPISPEFLLTAAYSLVLATVSYYMFAPMGTRSERLESATYKSVVERWAELSRNVREGGFIEAFYRFCTVRREEEREERRLLFIEAAGIPMSVYEERYAGLSNKQLRKLRRAGELTRVQLKYLKAANGEIKVLPINPSMILSGLKVVNINDVGREKRVRLAGILKPLTLILTMVIRAMIHIGGNEDISFVDYITQIAADLFIILLWSFNGFRYGVSCVRSEELVVKGRSEFISLFLERAKRETGVPAVASAEDAKLQAIEGPVSEANEKESPV